MDSHEELQKRYEKERMNKMLFDSYRKNITFLQDLTNERNTSAFFKKYTIEKVATMLESPKRHAKELRLMSKFLYVASSHYYRLINYYSQIPTFNYTIIPSSLPLVVNEDAYRKEYFRIIELVEKYEFKTELPKMLTIALLEGAFFGLKYESKDSFYILPFDSSFAKVVMIDSGVYVMALDLSYFNTQTELLPYYGKEFVDAYALYKGDKEKNIKGDTKKKWFIPKNGICIKIDETDPITCLPIFASIFLDILRLDDYKLLKKAKTTLDNYKVLSMKIDCDENGEPKMGFEKAIQYYELACSHLPDGIGAILSPFTINEFSFQKSSAAEEDAVNQAENEFWAGSGTHGMMFGSAKASSSSSLQMATKPDEQIAFKMLNQISQCFNRILLESKSPYKFKIKFLEQSIFNKKEMSDQLLKAAQYGVSGSKLYYAASLDMTPSDVVGLAMLENTILKVTETMFTSPLISSNTISHSSDEVGASTVEEQGKQLGDNTEASREQD